MGWCIGAFDPNKKVEVFLTSTFPILSKDYGLYLKTKSPELEAT